VSFKRQLSLLGVHAERAAENSYVPYSGRRRGAALLLDDGAVVPGVRVENASFSLTVSAPVNAITTAVALGRTGVLAVALSSPASDVEAGYLSSHPLGNFARVSKGCFVREDMHELPEPLERIDPFLPAPPDSTPETLLALAERVSSAALVPESGFPVGCVLEMADGRLLAGVNVEHSDWSLILCAERNALTTAVTWGGGPVRNVYLGCPKDPLASPCGSCRQVLVELAPEGTVWMDRGTEDIASVKVEALLPGHFSGRSLIRDS